MGSIRTAQIRTRPQRSPRKTQDTLEDYERIEMNDVSDDEPPHKRLRTSRKSTARSRWIPGGRGGGGRRIDVDDASALPTTPINNENEYPVPRTSRRDSSRRTATTSRYSARSRNRGITRPRYSTANAATAAAAHGDGYKPREERGWEEFHPDLDLNSCFAIVASEEVDGAVKPQTNGELVLDSKTTEGNVFTAQTSSSRRRPGRPHRTQHSMLQALLTPEQPKFVPRPGPNPRERLTLPKPSYRVLDPFLCYEQKDIAAVNFVNQAMANVGYQESELYIRPERTYIRQTEGSAEEDLDLSPDLMVAGLNSAIGGTGVGRVEYDMDEQDVKWLDAFNKTRTDDGVAPVKPAIFEITMTKIEKEWHALEKRIPKPNPKAPQTQRPRSSSAAAVNGEPLPGEEPDSKCAICDDGDCENANAIVFCDGCDLAVHQECYGVPYIPEGQWLCRKCQLVGNARPSCIFCPNEGGAFKQTNNSKWAHLLCANWIPEVTIGNPSLMEPITDVEKVPNSRWKLHCYICRQDMGASIQCSDGRCYEAFHLTCARQAGLYLKMKIGGGQNTLMDSSQLRAYCHRHTPTDWRVEHNTDRAFEHAVKYFKAHFQGQIWADSRSSALAIASPETSNAAATTLKMTLTNKKGQKPKTIWRLPSGAPVIPEIILKSIEDSLLRFSVPKKKEYVSEVCKYWTLKREARRGAALLKRLQLQMDTFSSFEVTRRDYKAQGVAGRVRLERRVEFAENLAKDLDRIKAICALIKEREAEKVKNALLMKDIIETVYYPIPPLLAPILDRASKLDPKNIYLEGLTVLRDRLSQRFYTSVSTFSSDFAKIFITDLGFDAANKENLGALYTRPTTTDNVEHRDRRTLARRIVKAVQPALEDALRKEAELNGRPFEQQMKEMDEMLLFSRRHSLVDMLDTSAEDTSVQTHEMDAADVSEAKNTSTVSMQSIGESTELVNGQRKPISAQSNHLVASANDPANSPPVSTNGTIKYDTALGESTDPGPAGHGPEPPTPPMSTREQQVARPLTDEGGIPWYVQQFDPDGTTVWEERWTGMDVLRAMSEELSEMDEDELLDLAGSEMEMDPTPAIKKATLLPSDDDETTDTKMAAAKKAIKKRKGNHWSDRSFRVRR